MKKETHQLQLYTENNIQRVYFITGAGIVIGSLIGGVQGIVNSIRNTQGKKRGMEYFCATRAKTLGRAVGLAAYSFGITEYLLSKLPGTGKHLLKMVQ